MSASRKACQGGVPAAGDLAPRLEAAVWTVVVGLLAAALIVRAGWVHADNLEAWRRVESARAESARLEGQNRGLRAEADALRNDPLYVEMRLRHERHVEPGEELDRGREQSRVHADR